MVNPNIQPSLFPDLEPETPVFDVGEAARKIAEWADTPEHKLSVDTAYNREAARLGLLNKKEDLAIVASQDTEPENTLPIVVEDPEDNEAWHEHLAEVVAKQAGRISVDKMNANERRHIKKARADRRASGF